jgi:uncharacterized protein YndB with AHSA1/START domain
MRELPAVELEWIETAPVVLRVEGRFAAPPGRVFEAFADAPGWTGWFPSMTRSAWTAGGGGVGSEREVSVRGFGAVRERFLAWEPGARFSFTMIGATSPLIRRMGEDYRLSADGAGARLDVTVGIDPTRLGRVAMPIARRILGRSFRGAIARLDRRLASAPS